MVLTAIAALISDQQGLDAGDSVAPLSSQMWLEAFIDQYVGGSTAFGEPRGSINLIVNEPFWRDESGGED